MSPELKAIVDLYRTQVLARRVRTVQLLGRRCQPQIMYTFLGFEVKLGKKRVTCPDRSTARYLALFGATGVESIAIPYDPTETARLLPQLERAFEGLKKRCQDRSNPDWRNLKAELQKASSPKP
ncbi:MAG: hypothetical protein HY645_10125 [Acidobacteria bacterium]|nr:hypothetical protein [Acidobacteriota bacterium]